MSKKSFQEVPIMEVLPTNSVTIVDGSLTSLEFEMTANIRNLYCALTAADNSIVYLPPLHETVGGLYTVFITSINAGKTVTIKAAKQDPQTLMTSPSLALSAAEHYALYMNVGSFWKLIEAHST